jgi:S-(hydroxymethyl)glutathione dehydrogenase / alcohol dehydrogenase
MRAAVVNEYGQEKITVRDDVKVLGPDEGEVRVKIKASGVCHSDISAMDGTLPASLPAVLGHEGAGEVVEVGPGVKNLQPGDRVIAAWIPPCGTCRTCLHGQPNLCMVKTLSAFGNPRFEAGGEKYFGMAGTGTFADETVMPQEALIAFDADVPFDIGALIGCGVMTGVGAAINTAQITPGSSVAVIGCGGVGIAAIQGARLAGAAEIVAIDMVDRKLDWAKQFGATHGVKGDAVEDAKNELTAGEGFDYVLEVVGRGSTIRQAVDLTRRGGTTVVVGAGKMDDMVSLSAFELFYMEKKLLGSLYGGADVRRDFPRIINLWKNGRLDLEGMITQRLPLDQVNEAFASMTDGEVIRTVITT